MNIKGQLNWKQFGLALLIGGFTGLLATLDFLKSTTEHWAGEYASIAGVVITSLITGVALIRSGYKFPDSPAISDEVEPKAPEHLTYIKKMDREKNEP